jgi:hypothetical protein
MSTSNACQTQFNKSQWQRKRLFLSFSLEKEEYTILLLPFSKFWHVNAIFRKTLPRRWIWRISFDFKNRDFFNIYSDILSSSFLLSLNRKNSHKTLKYIYGTIYSIYSMYRSCNGPAPCCFFLAFSWERDRRPSSAPGFHPSYVSWWCRSIYLTLWYMHIPISRVLFPSNRYSIYCLFLHVRHQFKIKGRPCTARISYVEIY